MTDPRGSPGQGREYYERSGYFESGGEHLRNPDSAFHRYRVEKVLELCGDLAGKRVVDLGAGWGTISFALAREASEVVGIDFAETAVQIGRRRLEVEPLAGLRFLRADAADTGLPGASWDLVVAADLVEHLDPERTRAVYREAHRLLRPGGRLVIWTPNPGHILEGLRRWGVLRADPSHIDYKTLRRVIEEVQAAGLEVEVARYVESHLPGFRWVERLTQGFVPAFRRRIAVSAFR